MLQSLFRFLLSDLKHIDKGIDIEYIEVDKKYTFIRDVDYKNFKFKEKSIIAFTGKTDISGNKEILVNGLIYIKDTQGISYITSKSFFLTNPVSAKIFEIEEN